MNNLVSVGISMKLYTYLGGSTQIRQNRILWNGDVFGLSSARVSFSQLGTLSTSCSVDKDSGAVIQFTNNLLFRKDRCGRDSQ